MTPQETSQRTEPLATVPVTTLQQHLGRFHSTHWRIVWTVVFGVLPFISLFGSDTYTDSLALNILHFLVILVICWAVAGLFLVLHRRLSSR
jgi:hypothetical protein